MNEMNKENVLLFGLLLEAGAQIFDDGVGMTEEDVVLYRNAAAKVYGLTEKSSVEDHEIAEKSRREDMKLLVDTFRSKVKAI